MSIFVELYIQDNMAILGDMLFIYFLKSSTGSGSDVHAQQVNNSLF